jgi:hypothetical protein
MNNLAPGILSVHFGYAVILTAIISVIPAFGWPDYADSRQSARD